VDESEYVARLTALQGKRWKRVLRVQAPYHAHLRRRCTGPTLDIGCGIGRNLRILPPGSIGIDTNAVAVAETRRLGMEAFTPDQLDPMRQRLLGQFSTLLFSHVLEHMTRRESIQLLVEYLPYLNRRGKVVVFCPQELGFRSDETHVDFVDFGGASEIFSACGVQVGRQYSFPLPRAFGTVFPYNEFVTIGSLAP
jgi:SAM-dependent methyltransferase